MRNAYLYPPDWQALATACKERAGWRCEHCHIRHRAWRRSKRTGRRYRVYLQAAHKNHLDRAKSNAELLCLCFSCHARYDYQHDQRLADIRLHSLKHRHLLKQALEGRT
jgi:hypothetical protein